MIKYCIITVFAVIFLFACENNTRSIYKDTTPQNDEVAVTDDDGKKDDNDISDLKDEMADEDMVVTDDLLPDDTQDDVVPDESLPDEPLSDNDIVPATSTLTYNNTVEPWSGGANILEGSASFITSPVDPVEFFTVPAPFETNKSFVTFRIYKENNSPESLLVTLSRIEMGGTLPTTVTLQGPPNNAGLSRAERYDDTLITGHLTGDVTITAFDEGGMPGATVSLVLSGDALTFTPTN